MHRTSNFFNSISPVNIYKSASAIYMSCLAKLAPSVFNPTCTTELAIEEAIGQTLNESISPKVEEAQLLYCHSKVNVQTKEQQRELKLKKTQQQQDDYLYDDDDDEEEEELPMPPRKALKAQHAKKTSHHSLTAKSVQNKKAKHQLKLKTIYKNDQEPDDHYLHDDDEEDDLLMSTEERLDLLQSKYDRIVKSYESELQMSISNQYALSFQDKLLFGFCLISICVSAYVINKDCQKSS